MSEYENYKPFSKEAIRYLERVHDECYYYYVGIDRCRRDVQALWAEGNRPSQPGFLECKPLVDSFYRCTTFDLYAKKVEDMEPKPKKLFEKYAACMFKEDKKHGFCRKYFDQILAHYVDQPGSPLAKKY